ncbi:LuxR C-terminal-related transcriptional regulator [Nocardioides sp. NPDC127503]|uniref:helix-turn-helix transcriptional regulator n=1 Tax=Nocardioides sp. NPDC127503 TaxID=3154516 RepID=UPI00332D0892
MTVGRPLSDRLQATVAKTRSNTGVSLAFGGVVDQAGVLLKNFDGPLVGPLSGVQLDAGHGLGGKVASMRTPMVVNDYVSASRITHRYDRIIQAEGLRSMIAVPVVVRDRTIAVVYGAFRGHEVVGNRIYDAVISEARRLEHALVAAELVETAEVPNADDKIREENRRLQAMTRDAYTRLRLLAARTTDPGVRDELLHEAALLGGRGHCDPELPFALTVREGDVLALVAGGMANARIATTLGLTIYTVKSYMKSIMFKLGASTRHEAVVIGRRHGLLP